MLKKLFLLPLLLCLVFAELVLMMGCGTPRERSNDKMKAALLEYRDYQEKQATLATATPEQAKKIEAELEILQNKALKMMQEAVKEDPTNIDAINNYGLFLQGTGYPNEAIPVFLQGLSMLPKPPFQGEKAVRDSLQNLYVGFHNYIANSYMMLPGKADSAVYYAEQIKEEFPSLYAKIARQAGIQLQAQKKFDEAIRYFEASVDAYLPALLRNRNDENIEGNEKSAYNLEQAYRAQAKAKGLPKPSKEDYAKMIAGYEKAIASMEKAGLDARNLPNYMRYADVCAEAGELKKADEAFKKAVALNTNPRNVAPRTNYGLFLKDTRRAREAVEVLRKVVDDNPDYALGYYNLATALIDAGRKAEAMPMLKKYVELGLKDPTEKKNAEIVKKEFNL
ncbi:MAG: tetratricopeptide repeat protein [Candidatus Thermochlorobacter sp.]